MRLYLLFAMLLATLAVTLATPAWADSTTPSAPKGGHGARVLASLERTPCFGSCPVYQLTIYADGRVEYQGERFVKVKGPAEAQLDARALRALRQAFSTAGYFRLDDRFDAFHCHGATDLPSANTSYDDGKRKKAISHYHGCSRPEAERLTTLEEQIDRIVKIERFIGTPEERERLREGGSLR